MGVFMVYLPISMQLSDCKIFLIYMYYQSQNKFNVYNSKLHNQSVVYHIVLSSKIYLAYLNLNVIVLRHNPPIENLSNG